MLEQRSLLRRDVNGRVQTPAARHHAGQIVEEHFVFRIKEITPAPREMLEERAFVFEDLVVALVGPVDLSKREVPAEQVGNGRVIKPMTVQAPLRARFDIGKDTQQEIAVATWPLRERDATSYGIVTLVS